MLLRRGSQALEQALQTVSAAPGGGRAAVGGPALAATAGSSYPPLNLTPQRQRQKTLEALVAWLLEEAEQQPVLAVWEDLHWADPSTLELLSLVVDQVPTARMLVAADLSAGVSAALGQPLASDASHAQPPGAPPGGGHDHAASRVARPCRPRWSQQIVAKTDGVPLFVEELTKMVLESGLLRERGEHYELTGPLPPLAIPATLQDSLMARLDRLATAKERGATGGDARARVCL